MSNYPNGGSGHQRIVWEFVINHRVQVRASNGFGDSDFVRWDRKEHTQHVIASTREIAELAVKQLDFWADPVEENRPFIVSAAPICVIDRELVAR